MSLECRLDIVCEECAVSQTIREAVEAFGRDVCAESAEDLSFPTSLDASRRVLRAVENPDIGMSDLSKIVVAEPLLSAKVIRLANSVALNPNNQPVLDVRHAVLRVGMDPIKALAMVLIMDQLRQSQRHSGCRSLCNQLWERSVHVAALSYVLARKLAHHLNADEAMFAGIVHDLGRFYLLSHVPDYPVLLEDPVVLAQCIDDLADQATKMAAAMKLSHDDLFKAYNGAVNSAVAKTGVSFADIPSGKPAGVNEAKEVKGRARFAKGFKVGN